MPKVIHKKLEASADKLKLKGKRKKAYIFGTLARIKARKKRK